MGRLWDLIQKHIDSQAYPPSKRQVARILGVSPSSLDNWKTPKALPTREHLEAISTLVGTSYATVLDAALDDTRYRFPPSLDVAEPETNVAARRIGAKGGDAVMPDYAAADREEGDES